MVEGSGAFYEVRHFRHGLGSLFYAFGGLVVLVGASVAPLALPLRLVGWVAGPLMISILALKFETSVTGGCLLLAVRPIWRKRIDVADITSTEVVLSDFQVAWFGGWNARENVATAFITQLEGDRSFGRTSVRMHLRSGGFQQVGTFRPGELTAAVQGAQRST